MNLTTADQIFMKLYLIDTISTNNVKDIKNINFKNSRKEKKKKKMLNSLSLWSWTISYRIICL